MFTYLKNIENPQCKCHLHTLGFLDKEINSMKHHYCGKHYYHGYTYNYNELLILIFMILLWSDNIQSQNKCFCSKYRDNYSNKPLNIKKSSSLYPTDSVIHKNGHHKIKKNNNIIISDYANMTNILDTKSLSIIEAPDSFKYKNKKTEVILNSSDLNDEYNKDIYILGIKLPAIIEILDDFKHNNKKADVSVNELSDSYNVTINSINLNPLNKGKVNSLAIVEKSNEFKQENKKNNTIAIGSALYPNKYLTNTEIKEIQFIQNFQKLLLGSLGKTVTIFVVGGGKSGLGFTGVILYINEYFVKLFSQVDNDKIAFAGNSITNIPLDKIVAFTHNNNNLDINLNH